MTGHKYAIHKALLHSAFSSKWHLYSTMGHEYIHAGFNRLSGFANYNFQEAAARDWEDRLGQSWGYPSGTFVKFMPKYIRPIYLSQNVFPAFIPMPH